MGTSKRCLVILEQLRILGPGPTRVAGLVRRGRAQSHDQQAAVPYDAWQVLSLGVGRMRRGGGGIGARELLGICE